jgi:hypothetical protein
VSTQTQSPHMPLANIETRPQTTPSTPAKTAEPAKPSSYWGDRLTILFWLFCFAVMLGINVIEAVQQMVLYVINRFAAP